MQKIFDLILEHKWSLAALLACMGMFGLVLKTWFDRHKENLIFLNWALGLSTVALILTLIWVLLEFPAPTSKPGSPTDSPPAGADPAGDDSSKPQSTAPPPTASPGRERTGGTSGASGPSSEGARRPAGAAPSTPPPVRRDQANETIWLNAGTLNSAGFFSANRGVPLEDGTSISEITGIVGKDRQELAFAGVDIRACPPRETPTSGCPKAEGGKFKFNGEVRTPSSSGRSVWVGLTRIQ